MSSTTVLGPLGTTIPTYHSTDSRLPANIFGGFEHTLFLGCSVQSFSASVGWNDQISELTVQLVQDPCVAPESGRKYYWDSNLVKQSTLSADPGFIPMNVGNRQDYVGMPALFRVDSNSNTTPKEGFEFSGLIQSFEQHESSSGYPTYSVKLVSPQEILQGVQLIIGEYTGSTEVYAGGSNVPNLYNCFGFMESFGSACGFYNHYGVNFGTLAGGFNGAQVNDNGMPWNNIATAFNFMCNGIGIALGANWGPDNKRVQFRSGSTGGYGLIPGSPALYYVDISEILELSVPSYYRFSGSHVGLLDAINQVCRDMGCDYYVELLPVYDGVLDSSGIAKFIKFRVARRNSNPTLGFIGDYVSGVEGTKRVSDGIELRNEITSTFYFGGNEEGVYQNEADLDNIAGDHTDIVLPYYGLDSDYNVIVPDKVDGIWQVELEITQLNAQLEHIDMDVNGTGKITIDERELLTALSSQDLWMSYEMNMHNEGNAHDIGTAIHDGTGYGDHATSIFNLKHVIAAINAGITGIQPRDLIAQREQLWSQVKGNTGEFNKEIDLIFQWLSNIANTYYGKQWSVRVPFTCAAEESGTGRIITTEVPQQDGWLDGDLWGDANILGLPLDSAEIVFFQNESGKYESFCRFNNANLLDLSGLANNDWGYLEDINAAFVRSQVESDWVYHDYASRLYPRGVVKLNSALGHATREEDGLNRPIPVKGLQQIVRWIWGAAQQAVVDDTCDKISGIILNDVLEHYAAEPASLSFGVKSNIMVYGPWGYSGAAGATKVEHISGLVPWEFGSSATMNLAGAALAGDGLSNMQYAEHGTITVPGYPTLPLGAELGAQTSFGSHEYLLDYRSFTTDSENYTPVGGGSTPYQWAFIDYPGSWDGTSGPCITRVTTTVDPSSELSTTYEFRTFTPKFGRLAKYQAEQLRNAGKYYLNLRREQAMSIIQNKRMGLMLQAIENKRIRNMIRRQVDGSSPHEVFAGTIDNWLDNTKKRTTIASMSSAEASHEIQGNYSTKAFMSLDGLIRPVSMDGDGGLPRYADYDWGCQSIQSQGSMPPVYEGNGSCAREGDGGPWYAGTRAEERVHQDYLNPFSNPPAYNRSIVVSDRSDSTGDGHDVDVIGRGSGIPTNGMPSHMAGYDNATAKEYDDDYRMFALRGPLLLQSWGYDLDGRPIPNKADDETDASGGTFVDDNLECKFLDDWLRKSHTWPVAPVDLRFDRQRGVWTCPPPTRKLRAKLCADLNSESTGWAEVTSDNFDNLTNCNGDNISYPMIIVEDKYKQCYTSGEELIVDYDPFECSYWILGRPSDEIVYFEMWDDLTYGGTGTGYIREYDSGWSTNADRPVTLYEVHNIFAKPENDSGYFRGSYGVAVRLAETCRYEILELEMPAEYVEFQLDSGVCSTAGLLNATMLDYGRGRNPEEFETWREQFKVSDTHGLFPTAPSGAKGKAVLDNVDEWVYNIVECETLATHIRFRLSDSLSDGRASGTLLEAYGGLDPTTVTIVDDNGLFPCAPSGATGLGFIDDQNPSGCVYPYVAVNCQELAKYVEFEMIDCDNPSKANVISYWQGLNPGETVEVHWDADITPCLGSGTKGIGSRSTSCTGYHVIDAQGQARIIRFTLDADLSGTPVSATPVQAYLGYSPESITVQDPNGLFPRAPAGASGIAVIDDNNPSDCIWPYLVIECQEYANVLQATVPDEYHEEDSSVSVSNVSVMHPQRDLLPNISTANNPLGWGGNNSTVHLYWDRATQEYNLIGGGFWVESVSGMRMLTDEEDNITGSLEMLRQQIKVIDKEYPTPTGWEIIADVTDCS